jgi:hypothetical protein
MLEPPSIVNRFLGGPKVLKIAAGNVQKGLDRKRSLGYILYVRVA